MFKPLDPQPNFPELEREVLNFWEKEKIFEKVKALMQGRPSFVFFEGPPTANGRPGLHHVEARSFKDVILRYQTMQGKSIVRKAGWDTQGLPVELEVEKSLKISGKPQIENLVPGDRRASIEKFNKHCVESVWRYRDEWEKFTRRMGFWIDLDDPYVTYDNKYIESLWWILKQLWDKKIAGQPLVYQGHKVLPYCTRCGTSLSSHEVAQGYREVKENSVYIKFRLQADSIEVRDANGDPVMIRLDRPTYFLSWTTTPWTLPGNVGLAVGEAVDYALVNVGEENFIVAEALLEKAVTEKYTLIEKFPGRFLLGLSYEPLFKIEKLRSDKSYRVYAADFVTTQEGTGIVHTAVMYGEDDYNLGTAVGLPKIHTVNEEGRFTADVPGLKNLYVKDPKTEKLILAMLAQNNNLLREELYSHDYPFCWRCGTALLYYARDSWFIRMSALRQELLANNEKIFWVPGYIQHGRFGEWLSEIKDWAISRERYWGTPLPFWKCEQCSAYRCVGGFAELPGPIKDVHRPYIDEVVLKCECGGSMRRVPEVLDVWFDAGAMPFAQWHYPFENREKIDGSAQPSKNPSSRPNVGIQDDPAFREKQGQFPADYISEAIDQTRGWFYTLLAIATALGYKQPPFKNVICLGHVLDEQGQKMSKSKGNVVDPMVLMEKFGIDIVRWYLFSVNQPGDPKRFSEADLVRMQRRIQLISWNVFNYFITYANSAGWKLNPASAPESTHLLDRWISAKLQECVNEVTENLDRYDVFRATRTLEQFIDVFSTWYLRRSRGRTEDEFFATFYVTLMALAKLLAPFMPFFSETVYRQLSSTGQAASVHMAEWPKRRELTEGERQCLADMQEARGIVEAVQSWRKERKLKVRQPLSVLYVVSPNPRLSNFGTLLGEELNFLEVSVSEHVPEDVSNFERLAVETGKRPELYLSAELTPELKARGYAREIERFVQELRKKSGLKVGETVALYYQTQSPEVYSSFEFFDQTKTYVGSIVGAKQEADFEQELDLEGQKLWLGIRKQNF